MISVETFYNNKKVIIHQDATSINRYELTTEPQNAWNRLITLKGETDGSAGVAGGFDKMLPVTGRI